MSVKPEPVITYFMKLLIVIVVTMLIMVVVVAVDEYVNKDKKHSRTEQMRLQEKVIEWMPKQ